MPITYQQARADHEYLWGLGSACDMTGGYVDSEDLKRLLKSPSEATARKCYCDQIDYWFTVGPDTLYGSATNHGGIPWDDPKVREIAARHGHTPTSI